MIRAFDGSLADAEGLLAVEQATFNECPYSAEQVRAMLTTGSADADPVGATLCGRPPGLQRAWLAVDANPVGATPRGRPLLGSCAPGSYVAGFVTAFLVSSRQGVWWEIDLLAVRPDRQGQGLGRRLIQAAAAGGAGLAGRSRAVVAASNRRSARAFAGAGFQAEPGACTLLIHRLGEQAPRPEPAPGVTVHEASGADALPASWRLKDLEPAEAAPIKNRPGPPTLLLAEQHGRPAGYAELIAVETLLYRGIWIESLSAPSRAVRETLVYHAVSRAAAAGPDEVSAMVPGRDQPLLHTLLAAGFRSLGAYRWFSADLPLGP